MRTRNLLITLSMLLFGGQEFVTASDFKTITNDVFWYTDKNKPIYSQGGGIFRFADPSTGKEHYYWYGVHYKGAETYLASPTGKNEDTGFVAVTCYKSDDLVNWTFVNNVLTASSIDWAYWVGRMGVAYVPEAKKYAILIQYNDNVLIATCDTPTGNFKKHNQLDMTDRIGTPNTGDQTVFTDDNGKSYLVYSYGKGRNKIYLSEIGLKDGKITLLDCNQVYKGSGREGNCMFKYKGKYYICASDLYGWNASNVYYLESSSIYGPYTPTNNMQKMEGAAADYGHVTQTGFFYTVKGSLEETVIYCGDRWADFAGNGNGYNQWVPLSFKDDKPVFNSLSQWCLNAETGEWLVGKNNNYIKNGSFDADRVNIPSGNKPAQTYLSGWSFQVLKGNKIEIGSSTSPVLNATNSSADRAVVIGNRCLYIKDDVDFTRKIYQKISSTESVPLPDGIYTLSAWYKNSAGFNTLQMYAKNGNDTTEVSLSDNESSWKRIIIDEVEVKNGSVEVGFYADAKAGSWCKIDDMSLVRIDGASALTEPKIRLTSGKENQTVFYGNVIQPLEFKIVRATGVEVTGLPDGVSYTFDESTLTGHISGKPSAIGEYNFTITTKGGVSDVTYAGVISVIYDTTVELEAMYPFDVVEETTPNLYHDEPASACGGNGAAVEGRKNQALSLNGSNHYVQHHYDGLNFGDKPFTIMFWMKSTDNAAHIIHKGAVSSANGGNRIGLEYQDGELIFSIDDDATKSEVKYANGADIFNGEWHHVAVIRDYYGKELRMFIDGKLKVSAADGTGALNTVGQDLVIGNVNYDFNNNYTGLLDELSIYRGVLSEEKIKEHFLTTDAKHRAYFTFDELTETTPNKIYGEATLTGNAQATEGIIDGAVLFDGTGYLTQPIYDLLQVGNNDFSIELWFKSTDDDGYVFCVGTHNTTNVEGGSGNWIGLEKKSDRFTFTIDDNVKKTDVNASNYAAVFDNKWHHVVCVRNATQKTTEIYLDGKLSAQTTGVATGAINFNASELFFIGGDDEPTAGNEHRTFNGAVDELIIHPKALSAEDIELTYLRTMATGIEDIESTIGENCTVIDVFTGIKQFTVPTSEFERCASNLKQGIYAVVIDKDGKRRVSKFRK